MGVDCYLYDGKNYCSLDRWYVFNGFLESKTKYTKKEMVERFNRIMDWVKITPDKEWEDVFIGNKDYYMQWVMKAKDLVEKSESDRFYLFTDDNMPEDFYSGGVGVCGEE